jgi:hypothetical protein
MSHPDFGPPGTDPLASRFAAYRGAVRSAAVAAPVAVLDERVRRRVRSYRIRLAVAGTVGVLALGALSVNIVGASGDESADRPDRVASSEPNASASVLSPSPSVSAGRSVSAGTGHGSGSGRTTPASAPPCRAAALRAGLRTPTVIATDVFVTLEFTNVSTGPCQVMGHPGLTLLGSGSTELPTVVRPDGTAAPVVLLPGSVGAALLRWTKPARPCGDVPQRVRVTAPGLGTGQVIGWIEPGLGAVCDGQIQTSAVQAT